MKIAFRPKLLDCLPGYNRAQFGKDLASGITVGVLALPLAMAFAIASGVSPTAGIWTAIVAGFLTAALGGSRVQIGGPFPSSTASSPCTVSSTCSGRPCWLASSCSPWGWRAWGS